jgi:hypothetical protein
MSSAAPKPPSAPNSTAPPAANPPPTSPPEWTETEYIAALARLETLQTRVDGLRLTVPTLVRALASPHANPDALFQEFQKVTLGPAKALVGLKRVLEENETREIMEFVRASFGNAVDVEAEGLTPFLEEVGRYGWIEELEKMKKEADGGEEKGKESGEEVSAVLGDEEMDSKLKGYMEKYKAVTGAEWDREEKVARVNSFYDKVLLIISLTKSRSKFNHPQAPCHSLSNEPPRKITLCMKSKVLLVRRVFGVYLYFWMLLTEACKVGRTPMIWSIPS